MMKIIENKHFDNVIPDTFMLMKCVQTLRVVQNPERRGTSPSKTLDEVGLHHMLWQQMIVVNLQFTTITEFLTSPLDQALYLSRTRTITQA